MFVISKDGSVPFVSKLRNPFPFLCSLLFTAMLVGYNRFSRPTAQCLMGSVKEYVLYENGGAENMNMTG